jgi:hypothetical protein
MDFRRTSPVTSFAQLSDWVLQVSNHALDPNVRSFLMLQGAEDEMNQADDDDEIDLWAGDVGGDM